MAAGPKVGDFHWSPDGRWLAFEQEDDIRNWDVWAVPFAPAQGDLAAGQPINLTDYPGFNDIPRWLGDGSRLLFRLPPRPGRRRSRR